VLERVIGAPWIDLRFHAGPLPAGSGPIGRAMSDGYDLVVLVNPNSPTDVNVPREQLKGVTPRTGWHSRMDR